MKIKIIKSSKELYWYNSRIGEVIDDAGYTINKDKFIVVVNNEDTYNFVTFKYLELDDCEILDGEQDNLSNDP